MKKYHIVEEETVKNIFEIEVPDDVAEKGEDAIIEYWYDLSDPGNYLIDSACQDCEVIEVEKIG